MSPYQHFMFTHSRNVNLTGLCVVIVWLAILFEFDVLVLPEDLTPLATIVRFGILIPLLLVALLFCYRHQYKWFTYTTTTAILIFTFWWQGILLSLETVPVFGLYTATINVLVGSSLLFALPFKVHLFCLTCIAAGVIAAAFYGWDDQLHQSLVYALGTGGSIIMLTHWIFLRERRYRALYVAINTSNQRLESRTTWNAFIRDNIKVLNQTRTKGIRARLKQLKQSNPKYRFLDRALDCIDEIQSLMTQFSAKQDWTRFSKPTERQLFGVQEHILSLLAELQLKHPNAKFIIDTDKDFECQIERSLFTRLLVNLLENAIRASTPDKAIIIEITQENVIAIENHGPPLDRPLSELIAPGAKSDHSGQFGLGLYVCAKICRANGLGLVAINTKQGVRMEVHFAPGNSFIPEPEQT